MARDYARCWCTKIISRKNVQIYHYALPPHTLFLRAQGLAVCRDGEAGGEFSPSLRVADMMLCKAWQHRMHYAILSNPHLVNFKNQITFLSLVSHFFTSFLLNEPKATSRVRSRTRPQNHTLPTFPIYNLLHVIKSNTEKRGTGDVFKFKKKMNSPVHAIQWHPVEWTL